MHRLCLRHLTCRVRDLNSRPRDWRRDTRPKHVRDAARRDRDAGRRQLAFFRCAGLVVMVLFAVATTRIHATFDPSVSGVFVFFVGMLLVDHYMVVEIFAELATMYRRLAGLDLPSMSQERRSKSAAARAVAAAAVSAGGRVRLARLTMHHLAARLRASLGTPVPTSHPRLAASLAAASAAP